MLACSVDQVSGVAAICRYVRLSVFAQDYALGQWGLRVTVSGWLRGACGGRGVLLVEHGPHAFILTIDLFRWS